jgi:hypothetical protein
MAESPTPVEDTPAQEPVKNKRTAARRLNIAAMTVVAFAGTGLYSVSLPWYTTHIPLQTLRDTNLVTVGDITATAQISGWGITHQIDPGTFARLGDPTLPATQPSALFGIPQPAVFLGLLALCVVFGALMRFGFLTGFGVIFGGFALNQLTTLQEVMTNPNFGGNFNTAAYGMSLFQFMTAASILGALGLTAQIALVNHNLRRVERERARAAGEPIKPTLLEILGAMQQQSLNRLMQMPSQVAQAKEDAANAHLGKDTKEKASA